MSVDFIVFCGVYFMVEVVDIMILDCQIVILFDLVVGCLMVDMVSFVKVECCWCEFVEVFNFDELIILIIYINLVVDLKVFCGDYGGIVCILINVKIILLWVFECCEKVLFFFDQYLGCWSGYQMGIVFEDMVVWDLDQEMGGLIFE